jgi:hypothetical protein
VKPRASPLYLRTPIVSQSLGIFSATPEVTAGESLSSRRLKPAQGLGRVQGEASVRHHHPGGAEHRGELPAKQIDRFLAGVSRQNS